MENALADFVDAWLMPLPLIIILLSLGCIALWRNALFRNTSFRNDSRGGLLLVSTAWLILVALSCTAISDLLLLPLEERYPKWNGQGDNLAFVVVMGAGQQEAPRLPDTNRPNTAAVYRLLEGIAVYRANPGSRLILSGGSGEAEPSAELMARVARTLGIAAEDIELQPFPHNTEQEVQLLAPMVGRQRFAVVTSAAHMPRTMQLFAAAGLRPTPAPTHFLDRFNPHPNWRDWSVPSADGLQRAQFALHEYLGIGWLRVKDLLSQGEALAATKPGQ
ncbi:MAG TPA: ElyC/SanA/YdcF family protein [Spongiibacteraceae bacterium]|nr:ElyC/SanA/YdcF family protein [Spongiibacteraceae bacterium]